MRAALILLLTALFALLLPSPALALAPAKTEKKIDVLTDQARGDLGALRANECLDFFAEKQARLQAKKKTMYHQDLAPVLKECNMSSVGENVAYGYGSAKAVQAAWMNSPGHRANIMGAYDRIGVGVALDSEGKPYYAVVFGKH